MSRRDICTDIVNRLIALLERGVAPWRRCWSSSGCGMPANAVTDKAYRGLNILALLAAQLEGGYTDSRWITYKQALQLGGHVRRGEKGTAIAFWRTIEIGGETHEGDESEDRKVIPLARAYTVFNVQQCEGLNLDVEPAREFEPIEAAERLVAGYLAAGPELRHGGDKASYCPVPDVVTMPRPESFDSPAHYHAVLFHELGHSTGHESRLNRPLGMLAGIHCYSQEELVAEFTAAMLCGLARIDNEGLMESSAAYLQHWAARLKDDPRCLIKAASQAQRAVDLIVEAEGVAAIAA